MNAELARELIRTKTVRELSTYLTSGQSFNPTGGTARAAFELAQRLKPVENQEEYALALKVKSYNESCGSLQGVPCDLCKNKGFRFGQGCSDFGFCSEGKGSQERDYLYVYFDDNHNAEYEVCY